MADEIAALPLPEAPAATDPAIPPTPWTARGSRVYAADGEEIGVATKASPRHRKTTAATAAMCAAAPELADVLLSMAKLYRDQYPLADVAWGTAYEQARAALAKAAPAATVYTHDPRD